VSATRSRPRSALGAALLLLLSPAALAATPPAQNILELQPARRSETVTLQGDAGQRGGVTLVSLNPAANAWFVLLLQPPGGRAAVTYHLENADPARQRLVLDAARPGQLILTVAGTATRCVLWPGDTLERARHAPLAYAPMCDGRLFLRNAVQGNRTTLEATTEFLRDHVWRGEQIVGFVRREFYRDAFIERAASAAVPAVETGPTVPHGAPPAAPTRDKDAAAVIPEGLGIDLGLPNGGARLGRWYAALGLDGVYVSVAQPRALAPPTNAAASAWRALDPVEATALDYLVAFDLAQFELGFALGTEHPRLGWSARVPDERREPGWRGPDGIDNAAPLVRTGMLSPALQARAVATFTGGFKREHGAFRFGALAGTQHGSHYGFVEQGVVFSALAPGLATLYVLDDGTIDMKTWRPDDDGLSGRIRHARQNGVPLLERGRDGTAEIGALVDQWGAGNWSGSADERLRTLRAGACIIEDGSRRFLLYGYFSAATPRAMAQVFLAYGCRYAMHLDMNALEHTYLALYPRSGTHIGVEHLVRGMSVLDKSSGGAWIPRFVGFADDRDFFYLVRRDAR
jgi:hypothetical protein